MNIIVFFNGWGVNKDILKKISPIKNYVVHYVEFPYNFDKAILKEYKEIIFVGWSFGAYYLSLFLKENKDIKAKEIIGINGNSKIIGEFGISKKILKLTIEGMSTENLKIFYKNMECFDFSLNNNLNIDSLISILAYTYSNFKELENVFTKLIISKNDKIIKTKNQLTYKKEYNVNTKIIEGGHYPFDILSSWKEIIT